MAANSIPVEKQANLFLATVGPEVFKLLKNLCSPEEPKAKTYSEITTLLTNHYKPEPFIIAERY